MRFRFSVGLCRICRVVPIVAAVVAAQPAAAHSELRGSVPAAGAVLDCAPTQIELQFNEGVLLTALRLHRVGGAEIELPRRTIREAALETIKLPRLEPGEFRAEWRIISPDGHDVGGAIPFSVSGECQP
jgi:methionine-rich copper-binding protein CopC